MSIDGAVIFARRWPRAGIAGLACALLVALGLISCPAANAARTAHGTIQHHRPAGKVFVTNDAPGPGTPTWNQTPDQDLTGTDHLVAAVHRSGSAAAPRDVAGRPVPCVHSRGPPG